VWQGRPTGEQTILAYVVETDDVFGFGCWKHTYAQLPGNESVPVIRIPYFGVDARFQGERDPDDRSWAGRLYAALEALARQHEDSEDGMPVELFCIEENERGRRFWTRRGFEDIGKAVGGAHVYRRFVKRAAIEQ
jgi:GNAT superfamily N-acetyltransferase